MNPEYIKKELMEARRPKYETAADFVIKTDNRTAEEICLEINKRLKQSITKNSEINVKKIKKLLK